MQIEFNEEYETLLYQLTIDILLAKLANTLKNAFEQNSFDLLLINIYIDMQFSRKAKQKIVEFY